MKDDNPLRKELSLVMKERRDALQRAWNAEIKLRDLLEAAEAVVKDWRKPYGGHQSRLRAAIEKAKVST